MGCSASLVAVKLVSDLLQARPNCRALIVSTENLTLNWSAISRPRVGHCRDRYRGEERAMLVTNTLFRLGCAAVLLSNRSADRTSASRLTTPHSPAIIR